MSLTWTPAADGDPTFTPAGTISSDRVTVGGETLTDVLDDLGPGGGADHTVDLFTGDFDAGGGAFTEVPLFEGPTLPRSALVGVTVAVTIGDSVGLWTVTASGPCTPGAALTPGDVVASGVGRIGVAFSVDASTVVGITVAATTDQIDALDGRVDALDGRVDALDGQIDVAEVRARMVAQAERVAAPTRWALAGITNDTRWAADWRLPDPTSTVTFEALVRLVSLREPGFWEFFAEPLDGTGDVDRFEVAAWGQDLDGDVVSFAEGTAPGASIEWQRPPNAQQDNGATAPMSAGPWVRLRWHYDFAAHTITTSFADDVVWDTEAAGRRWSTIGTYANPGITGLHAPSGDPSWIGRGTGEYHIAEIMAWVDGTLEMHFDASTAAVGATTVVDLVAVDGDDEPIEWVSSDGDEVDGTPTGGGAVDSVNGQTGTVVLDSTDVGADPAGTGDAILAIAIQRSEHTGTQAQSTIDGLTTDLGAKAPTTRSISAGTGLTGGGDLSADRTLAIDAATLARIGVTVDTTADVGPRTSTTATADGALEFAAAADTTYRIDAYLIFQGDTGADLKVGFTAPAGTMHLTIEGALTTVASNQDYDRFLTLAASNTTTVVGIAGASTPIAVRITGVIHTTAAGTVALIWAPNAAGAGTGVTRLARSQIYYRTA